MFNIKKIIIIVLVIALAFGVYAYFFSNSATTSSSGVTKQAVSTASTGASGSAVLDGPGKEFVTQLLAIQNIKFNLQLFADPVFQGLQDWSRELIPQESGRPNPFAPLDNQTGSQSDLTSFSGDISSGGIANGSTPLGGGSAVATSSSKTAPAAASPASKPKASPAR